MQKDLEYLKSKDEELKRNVESKDKNQASTDDESRESKGDKNKDEDVDKKSSEDKDNKTQESELLSNDMRRELLRQQWEKEEEELRNKSNIHYQDVLFGGENFFIVTLSCDLNNNYFRGKNTWCRLLRFL